MIFKLTFIYKVFFKNELFSSLRIVHVENKLNLLSISNQTKEHSLNRVGDINVN